MSWVESGRAWGERAADWAYLVEPYARGVNDALFDRARVGPGTRLLDIACGSGYAASVAAGRGAVVCGLDASAAPLPCHDLVVSRVVKGASEAPLARRSGATRRGWWSLVRRGETLGTG